MIIDEVMTFTEARVIDVLEKIASDPNSVVHRLYCSAANGCGLTADEWCWYECRWDVKMTGERVLIAHKLKCPKREGR
jgi:hypothetical protein